MLKFSTAIDQNEIFYLENSNNQSAVQSHIQRLTFSGGNTNTSGALRFMTNHMFNNATGDRNFVSDIAILLTDGLSNIDQHMTTTEALNAKRKGIKIFTIGIALHIIVFYVYVYFIIYMILSWYLINYYKCI